MSDPNPPASAPAATPGRKKLVLIIAIAAVLLAGGGIGAYFMSQPSGKDAAHPEAGAATVQAEPIYVALDPAFVVNFESNDLVRFLQVSVQVMTRDPAAVELVKRHDPVIRNGLLLLLSGQHYRTLSSTEGKEKLRQAALAEVRKVVAAQGGKAADINDLYFTSFVMQ
jgi:flagellar FliL protein